MSNQNIPIDYHVPRYRHGRIFRCSICGKFLSYAEIDSCEVKYEFIPDTERTMEETTFTHIKCLDKNDKKAK